MDALSASVLALRPTGILPLLFRITKHGVFPLGDDATQLESTSSGVKSSCADPLLPLVSNALLKAYWNYAKARRHNCVYLEIIP